jgi:hypothetical protein
MKDFIEKMLELGGELEKTDSHLGIIIIINDAEILYRNHIKQLSKKEIR